MQAVQSFRRAGDCRIDPTSSRSPRDRYRSSWERQRLECRDRLTAGQCSASRPRQSTPAPKAPALRNLVWSRRAARAGACGLRRVRPWPRTFRGWRSQDRASARQQGWQPWSSRAGCTCPARVVPRSPEDSQHLPAPPGGGLHHRPNHGIQARTIPAASNDADLSSHELLRGYGGRIRDNLSQGSPSLRPSRLDLGGHAAS